MSRLDWSDGLMLLFLAIYALAISRHVSLGRSMFVYGQKYSPLSSSTWIPSDMNARQVLLLGMYWVAVPMWIVHVSVLVLVLFFEPRLIAWAGTIAALSTAAQGFVAYFVLGTSRAPGKVLVTHYLVQTLVAAVWAFDHRCGGCAG